MLTRMRFKWNWNWSRVVAAASFLLAGPHVLAGSHTWSGATNGLWSVAGNWSAGGVPTAAESPLHLIFPPGAKRINITNDITGLQVDSLTLTGATYTLFGTAGKTITLKGGTNIVANESGTIDASLGLVLSNTNYFNVGTNMQLQVQSPMSGTGTLAKIGAGELFLSGPATNTYSGATLVIRGSLVLQRGTSVSNSATAAHGPLVIGTADPLAGAQVTLAYSKQLASAPELKMFRPALLLFIAGVRQEFGGVTLNGGTITGPPDTLLILRSNLVADVTSFNADIGCPVSLGGTNRTFQTIGTGLHDLNVHGEISDGGSPAGFTKTGGGILSLHSSNSYSGVTVISAGFAEIYHPFALGSAAGGTVISNGASLRLIGRFNVTGEALTVSGDGINQAGAIYADFDTNTWSGPVTLAADTQVFVLSAQGRLTLSGPISGPGGLTKTGDGVLTFSGTSANSYSGTTTVAAGKLELSKTNAQAIAGLLVIGDDDTPTNNATVKLLLSDQIGNSAPVTVNGSGLLGFTSTQTDAIGSLAGNGRVDLAQGTMTVGGNNSDCAFGGIVSGTGVAPLVKTGSGSLVLNGTNTCSGTTAVNDGKLVVNGVLPGPMQVNFLSSIGGAGIVGNLTATLGHLAPGNSVGKITTGNLSLNNAGSSLDAQLNGPTPGAGYDQIVVNGTVNLSAGPTLNVSVGFPGTIGAHYVIIANDGVDPVTGTFNGLPEGTNFIQGGVQFKISYKGGDGNDVELTQLSLGEALIGGITPAGGGTMKILGLGVPGLNYTIEANTNLSTTNWVNIGSALAATNGAMSFIDLDAPKHVMRFYRFKAP